MAATVPWNKPTYMKEWMAPADPPKDASTVKKNEWPVASPLLKANDTLL